jgi:NADH-quinone oxidoreductase subunit L
MLESVWLIPALPFAGFVAITLMGRRAHDRVAAALGACSIGLSMVVSFLVAVDFGRVGIPGFAYSRTLWTWFAVDGFRPVVGLYLDGLSLVMTVVVTTVAFLIHLYSISSMAGEEGYRRFFAYMNLFVGSMLTLVLADNLLLLYLGWEGVGLCSYLLIGFWYRDPANGRAAIKAFMVTRIGDAVFAVGLFLLFFGLGTLQIQEVMQKANGSWPSGSSVAIAASALLLAGAVGKSAQLPLQTWLPDAMAGPTPVSALIHAATMVTAGVYLIARMDRLFALAPIVQLVVAIIGAATLLVAAASALVQRDIKRILAYSTMSQVGYMFLALGVGAWSAAIFHFTTHAFFKALLFLSAGVVIQALDNEHDIFRMGGLRKRLPIAFWTFFIGAASLSALPFITAGFYSKEMILGSVWTSVHGGPLLWTAGLVGAAATSIYAFRAVFVVFFGKDRGRVAHKPGLLMTVPLGVLAFFSITIGFIEVPKTLGSIALVSDLLGRAMQDGHFVPLSPAGEWALEVVASLASLLGIAVAGLLYLARPGLADNLATSQALAPVRRFWFAGWGFDRLYSVMFVRPFVGIARLDKGDVVDTVFRAGAWLTGTLGKVLSLSQSGNVRWYVMGVAFGALVFLGIVVFS